MKSPAFELVPAGEWETWSAEHNALIIDVREPKEWAQGVLPGSELVSLETLPGHIADLDEDQAILLVCRTGNRSGVAARYLAMNGFTKVANLTGGLHDLGMA